MTYYNATKFNNLVYAGFIKPDIAVVTVSKCGSSTIAYLASLQKNFYVASDVNKIKYQGLNEVREHLWDDITNDVLVPIDDIVDNNVKIVAIFRDPIERFVSAWNTIGKQESFEGFIKKALLTFQELPLYEIDKHILPQCLQYDQSKVDLFVNICDLHNYFHSIGINNTFINQTNPLKKALCSNDIINKYKTELERIYEKDFQMIANIPESKRYKAV